MSIPEIHSEAPRALKLRGGERHYRAFIGGRYDVLGAMQFNLLTLAGLKEDHRLLDIGCGSLRAGRLFIPYLLPGRYFGIEPQEWLVREGVEKEVGSDLVGIKRPTFSHISNFELSVFGVEFDYILAHSIFPHTSKQQIRTCLRAAMTVMKSTSSFFATFHPGKSDYEGDMSHYPGIVPYTPSWIARAAKEAGLQATFIDWPHTSRQRWVAFTRADAPREVVRSAHADHSLTRAARRMRLRRTPLVGAAMELARSLLARRKREQLAPSP